MECTIELLRSVFDALSLRMLRCSPAARVRATFVVVSHSYPSGFTPEKDDALEINLGKVKIHVPRAQPAFARAPKRKFHDDFGNKPLVSIEGRAMFAELGIVQSVIADGWQARWVCTFGRGRMNPLFLKAWDPRRSRRDQIGDPIADASVRRLLERIAIVNGKYGGCWDVVAWRDRKVLFLESKLHKKDHIQETQMRWMMSAFESGLSLKNFLIVEWHYK